MKTIRILGMRGIPARHGGFETFAERLALYLRDRGWRVIAYCQESSREGAHPASLYLDRWQGIERVHIVVNDDRPADTMRFDWRAIRHAMQSPELCLTLGYNTALFCALLRVRRIPNVINMDGIEWRRAKWGPMARAWLWVNERAGSLLGDHLVADHPEIERHLASRGTSGRITTIAYGADALVDIPPDPVLALGLQPGRYLTLIARPEPENSVLEVVQGFCSRPRGITLAVLGAYSEQNSYHRAVRSAAGDEVRFLGAIYDRPVVQALRLHCLAYVHGHRVGGTNPSLVEALGAGNAVLAHDNAFNRWVAGPQARYFGDAAEFSAALDALQSQTGAWDAMRRASRERFEREFTWDAILADYERLLTRLLPAGA